MEKQQNKSNLQSLLLKRAAKGFRKKYGLFLGFKGWMIIGVVSLFVLFAIGIIASVQTTSTKSTPQTEIIGGTLALSEDVLKWQSTVEEYANEYEVPELVPYILAIMQVESGGKIPDLMQSSESLGLPVNTLQYEESIEQGVKYLKNTFERAKVYGNETDFLGIIQAYNFGSAYITYLGKNGLTHNIDTAEQYSKDVVAPSLGNHSGAKNSYVNSTSIKFGKTYLYKNGGNFFYSYLVQQYLGASGGSVIDPQNYFDSIMQEALKFNGWTYVWGGDSPTTGFDCSGLVQWIFAKAGITTGRVTKQQWANSVPISPEEARSGDLVFFKGTYGTPDNISHVGIYINETTMYDASSSGVGYKTWNDGYWAKHFAGIRRLKTVE